MSVHIASGRDSSPLVENTQKPGDMHILRSIEFKHEDAIVLHVEDEKVHLSDSSAAPMTTAKSDVETKQISQLWIIHGNYYDLEQFIQKHPGGQAILRMSRGIADVTPLMESYHTFANKDYIARTLSTYEVSYTPIGADTRRKTEITYTFEPDGFYMTLVRRIRSHFGSSRSNESVTRNIKANRCWMAKAVSELAVFLITYAIAFVLPIAIFRIQAAAAAISGVVLISLGMIVMHDASHFAIGIRDSWKNKLALRMWNAISLWDPAQWLYHHAVMHHSFTGDTEFDPDTMHAKPFVRKTLLATRSKYLSFPVVLAAERGFWALYAVVVYTLSPGMYVGQVLSYRILWPFKGRLWKMSQVPTGVFHKYLWEDMLTLLMVGIQVYRASPLLTFIFFTACNVSYAVCIIPDHDTFESAIENHIPEGIYDWGEVQVRHSSDFGGKGLLGRFFTQLFGGINLQIGHHLLPGVNHVYLPELVPIIKETCKEFNIPYAEQRTVVSALWSFVKTVHSCMGVGNDADTHEAGERKDIFS